MDYKKWKFIILITLIKNKQAYRKKKTEAVGRAGAGEGKRGERPQAELRLGSMGSGGGGGEAEPRRLPRVANIKKNMYSLYNNNYKMLL